MSQAYVGTAKRTFQQALIHLLESDYGLVGSRRILETLAEDAQKLADQFYPSPQHLSSGWMVFTGTRASGGKTHPGQSAGDHELVTLAWPVLLPEDVEYLTHHPDTKSARQEWFCQRLTRILEHGLHQPEGPVLLTLADLAAMLGLTTVQVSQRLAHRPDVLREKSVKPQASRYRPRVTISTKACVPPTRKKSSPCTKPDWTRQTLLGSLNMRRKVSDTTSGITKGSNYFCHIKHRLLKLVS